MSTDNSFDDIWELCERAVREAYLLRSFLEYLRTWDDPQEKKWERVKQWRGEIGLQLGNPTATDEAIKLFQTLRVLPPELRRPIVQKEIQKADDLYFPQD